MSKQVGWFERIGVALLLLGYYSLAVASVQNKCTTYDEVAYLTAGCAYWQFNDYRLHSENGNLPQRWCALPIVLSGCATFPAMSHNAWSNSDVWRLGNDFLYELNNPVETMYLRGRMMSALLGVGLAWLVWLWARRLWGPIGGLVSLAACALCPTMLAHGPLMTSDICAALFFLATTALIWETLHRLDSLRLIGCALATSALFLSKTSAVLILPIAVGLVLVRLVWAPPLVIAWRKRSWEVRSRVGQAGAAAFAAFFCALISFAAIWLAYGGRYTALNTQVLPDGHFPGFRSLDGLSTRLDPTAFHILKELDERRLLPQAYLYGTGFVLASQKRSAFYRGEHSTQGWITYFPYTFLVKTPWPFFALLGLALLALLLPQGRASFPASEGGPLWYQLVPLVLLWSVYWIAALSTTLNIGHRHILPTYPPLFILAGAAVGWLQLAPKSGGRVLLGGVLLWSVLDTMLYFPHYLAYFNSFVDPLRAHHELVDSNLDWGQDLPGLRDWLARNPHDQPIYLAYFGMGSPRRMGIKAVDLPPAVPGPGPFEWKAGTYCISVTHLQSTYYDPGLHQWRPEYNKIYAVQQNLIARMRAGKEVPPELTQLDHPSRLALLRSHAILQYLRLLVYFRNRPPDGHAGYSILIFRPSEQELDKILGH